MKSVSKAGFEFNKFQIPSFSFNTTDGETENEERISIQFLPSGSYNIQTGIFKLYVTFSSQEEISKKEVIKANFIAEFRFDANTDLEQIPSYFYRNALAIAFPYLRSFISTMSLQAGIKLIILPILNTSNLEQLLKDNTVIEGDKLEANQLTKS